MRALKHTILLMIALLPIDVSAQYYFLKRQNEASVYVFGGWQALLYTLENGSVSTTLGGGAGAGYTYYFNNYWSLVTGFEVGTYGADASIDMLHGGKHERHTDRIRPPDMILNSEFERYTEKQNAIYGHIPLMAQLLIPAGDTYEYYLSAGLKVGMLLSGTFQTSFKTMTISAWLPYSGQTIASMPQLGFVQRENLAGMYDASGDLPLRFNIMGAVEGGIRWVFEDGAALYTGIYLDYGLLSVQQQNDVAMVMSTQQVSIFEQHSILESAWEQQAAYPSPLQVPPITSERYTNRVHIGGAGIKIRLAFNASGIPIITRRVRCGCPKEYY
jgi:hypothetical protein